MDNPRPEKVAVVDEVREKLSSASAAILTEYRGLKVKDISALRRSLREVGGEYRVYKNTLVRFAARDLGLDELVALLEGPTAIAFVDGDAVAVAKALRDYARTNPNLVVKGGLLGQSVLDAREAGALAELPSREVLLARIAGAFAAPMVQFAGLLQALPRNLAYGLKALIEKGGGPDAPAQSAAESLPAAEAAPAPEGAAQPAAAPEPEAAAEPEPASEPGDVAADTAAEASDAQPEPESQAEVNDAAPAERAPDVPAESEPASAPESESESASAPESE